ncbi:MAG: hypothetical protein FJ189_07025 [Gammaproteobacteria bacterium]|nr:hypothetical protein [Gammaproteobacteria bacterium]
MPATGAASNSDRRVSERHFIPTVRIKGKENLVTKPALRLAWVIIPIISGCQTGTVLDEYMPSDPPTVSGFPGAKPPNVRSVVVWGNDERTIDAAATWVKAHGLTVIHRDRLHEALGNQVAGDDASLIKEETIVQAASAVGADAVVFADRANESRPPLVTVKGVDARTGRLIWTGDARYDTFFGLPNTETMTVLTDQALMTAWGLQPKED